MAKFNVTVQFAHGIEHTFTNMNKERTDDIRKWFRSNDGKRVYTVKESANNNDSIFLLNRDYVCAIHVQRVHDLDDAPDIADDELGTYHYKVDELPSHRVGEITELLNGDK